ncbi:hypothetical protein H4R18_004820 [Coemansia javaensis]|uniref:DUF7137 domain-containing protein n=1 Tax=Coemansia javaensis TaxID=2761396 RepID=A0A9W8H3B0_9FUNG|nr:hypothetical protein H4R18_004820 [Coemansia javaensis]
MRGEDPKPTPTKTTTTSSSTKATKTSSTKTTATDKNDDDDDNNNNEPTESFDESYEETGMPGSVLLQTPDYMSVPTPMFEIGEKVTLGWKYTNDTARPPAKLSICGKFPRGSNKSPNPASLCDWDIAVNISGSLNKYIWDTRTVGAPGVAFVASSGYLMYFYDGDYGVNNPRPGAGRIVPSLFWFNMYNSRYDQTNQGVPAGYDPSPAAPAAALRVWSAMALTVLAVAAAMG